MDNNDSLITIIGSAPVRDMLSLRWAIGFANAQGWVGLLASLLWLGTLNLFQGLSLNNTPSRAMDAEASSA